MIDTQLCKAKSISSGQWVYGYYVKGLDINNKEIHVIFEPATVFYSHGETDGFEEIDSKTLCRCTGSHDKNGKLIFENDLLGHHLNRVEWLNGEYCINGDSPLSMMCNYFEVIGNIFDKN